MVSNPHQPQSEHTGPRATRPTSRCTKVRSDSRSAACSSVGFQNCFNAVAKQRRLLLPLARFLGIRNLTVNNITFVTAINENKQESCVKKEFEKMMAIRIDTVFGTLSRSLAGHKSTDCEQSFCSQYLCAVI